MQNAIMLLQKLHSTEINELPKLFFFEITHYCTRVLGHFGTLKMHAF